MTVGGLHSFRQPQTVDFATLCQGGVFGIFGPTGSGKSSLLDAMTLALYGKVERALNNTQGIMNHAEDELMVALTFELGKKGEGRYRVERTFKRSGDITVRTVTCRLLHIKQDSEEQETIVLADKASDVQDQIYGLLGLTIEDFTRAVVLPQGKFAEFLTLKGTERRQMLQRLFHLEQYGDQLIERLRRRTQQVKGKIETIIAEQQGLGDASTEALQEAEQKLKDWEEKVLVLHKEREKMEKDYETKKHIWERQLERIKVEKQQAALVSQQDDMKAMEQRLTLAKEAMRLQPYVNELIEAREAYDSWRQALKLAQQRVQKAQQREKAASEHYMAVKADKEKREPELTKQQTLLEGALEVEKELTQLLQQRRECQQEIETLKDKQQQCVKETQQQEQLLHKALEKQKQLKKQRMEIQYSPEERRRVTQAQEAFQAYGYEQEKLAEKNKIYSQQQQLYTAALEKVSQALVDTKTYLQHGFKLQRSWLSWYAEAEQKEASLIQTIQQTDGVIRRLSQELEQKRHQHLAAELAAHLKNGEPCPVCGSIAHQPTSHREESTPQVAEQATQEKIESLRQWMTEAQSLKQKQQWLKERATTAIHGFMTQYHEWTSTIDPLQEISEAPLTEVQERYGQDIDQLKAWMEASAAESSYDHREDPSAKDRDIEDLDHQQHQSNRLQTISLEEVYKQTASLQETQEKVDALVQSQHKWEQDFQQSIKHLQALRYDYQSKASARREAEQNKEAQAARVSKKQEVWRETYPTWELHNFSDVVQAYHKRDEEMTSLQERIEKSIPFIETKEREVKEGTQQQHELAQKLAQRESTYQHVHHEVMLREQRIKALAQEGSIQDKLSEVKQTLQTIKTQEARSFDAWQEARTHWQQAEQEVALSTQSLEQAKARVAKAEKQWNTAREGAQIQREEDVQQYKQAQEEIEKQEQELQAYDEAWKQVNQTLQVIDEQIKGQNITADEWQQINEQKTDVEARYEQALEERGAATREKAALQERHDRYMRLEEERVKQEHQLEQLGKLQRVFRGNTFVEFIAERQLMQVCQDASQRLGNLTRQRYAIEVDSQGAFLIRDDANGGVKRPVSTLSGGETFLTSLALALALSAQIQLSGQYPLEFFFLDEGFGTLDQEMLDTVITALEQLQTENLSVGVISHVPELRERLHRRLMVTPAEPSGKGSRVQVETL
nr:SMC family ATPase [Caldalkalibacillus salinus]